MEDKKGHCDDCNRDFGLHDTAMDDGDGYECPLCYQRLKSEEGTSLLNNKRRCLMTDKPKEAKIVQVQPEDFAKHYEELCQKDRYMITPSLVWVARDDGTWSTKINMSVGPLPKETK